MSKSILKIPHYKILAAICLGTLVSWAGWLLVVIKLDPYETTGLSLSLFFSSFIFALAGSFAIILFFLKRWRSDDKVYVKHLTISIRQGFLLSTCTSICLGLLMFDMLKIWNGLLLVVLMMLIELYLSRMDELNG